MTKEEYFNSQILIAKANAKDPWEALTEMLERMYDVFSDIYKEQTGIRPRHGYFDIHLYRLWVK
jgi:hypothetical protein